MGWITDCLFEAWHEFELDTRMQKQMEISVVDREKNIPPLTSDPVWSDKRVSCSFFLLLQLKEPASWLGRHVRGI